MRRIRQMAVSSSTGPLAKTAVAGAIALLLSAPALAGTTPVFDIGNLVVSVEAIRDRSLVRFCRLASGTRDIIKKAAVGHDKPDTGHCSLKQLAYAVPSI